jgi:hypothetical protein
VRFQNGQASTIPAGVRQRNARTGRRFAFWPSVCAKHHPDGRIVGPASAVKRICTGPINAFLTLTAVTKW